MTSSRRGSKTSKRNKNDGWDESGGYMNAKIRKLENQFEKESTVESTSQIFNGISIFVNGYTKPPSDCLKKLMQQHGGIYHHYYSRGKVTHIVASNLPNSKIAALTDQKVVKPDWITDSIAAKRLLPYDGYLLYHSKGNAQSNLMPRFSHNIGYSDKGGEGKKQTMIIDDNKDADSLCEATEPMIIEDTDDVVNFDGKSVINSSAVSENNSAKEKACSCDKNSENLQPTFSEKSRGQIARAGDPNFVAEFYHNSRLHHISTWSSEFKAYVNSLQDTINDFPARKRLAQLAESKSDQLLRCSFGKVIMHIDMDCFFVSVGLRHQPQLKGKPIAVTHSKGKGEQNKKNDEFVSMAEIASCSYEARQCGVKNGMFMGSALKLCPDLTTIPYNFDEYNKVSKKLYNCIASLTVDIEAVSCDELFVDCTQVLEETGSDPLQLAAMLREDIKKATDCTASAGLGPNMLIARLATKKAKPNGQCYVSSEEIEEFMESQPVTNVPGIGRKLRHKFEDLNIITCKDLQQQSLSTLQKFFGPKSADTFYKYCRGQDDRQIQSEKVRKSVSAEINYGIRLPDWTQAEKFVHEVGEEVAKRLKAVSMTGKTITLKLKIRSSDAPKETAKFLGHGKCDNVSKGLTLPLATDNVEIISKHTMSILKTINPEVTDIRGLGIQISRLEKARRNEHQAASSILKYTCKRKQSTDNSSVNMNTSTISSNNEIIQLEDKVIEEHGLIEIAATQSLPPLPHMPTVLSTAVEFSAAQDIANTSTENKQLISNHDIPQSTSDALNLDTSAVFPSISQIDDGIFDELPDDIKKEIIEEDLKRKQRKNNLSTDKNIDIENASNSSSSASNVIKWPVLNQIPRASPSKSPRGRNRKKGSSHKPMNVPLRVPPSIPASIPRRQLFIEEKPTIENIDEITTEDSALCESKDQPQLSGAKTLTEVKVLIKQWIQSSAAPSSEDALQLEVYLQELLHYKDLEQILFILRHLKRQVEKTDSSVWTSMISHITDTIQASIRAKYGSTLKIGI